jgi:hypothetical protein
MLSAQEGIPMNQHRVTKATAWEVHSVFVPKRDGRQRVEMAIRFLLEPSLPSVSSDPRGGLDHESGDLRTRLDREAGTRPDD